MLVNLNLYKCEEPVWWKGKNIFLFGPNTVEQIIFLDFCFWFVFCSDAVEAEMVNKSHVDKRVMMRDVWQQKANRFDVEGWYQLKLTRGCCFPVRFYSVVSSDYKESIQEIKLNICVIKIVEICYLSVFIVENVHVTLWKCT